MTVPRVSLALSALLMLACTRCGSETGAPKPAPDASDLTEDCNGEGEPLQTGFRKAGAAGFDFELRKLTPTEPVQTSKPPGNVWSVGIQDVSGTLSQGTLFVSASMPLHNNHSVSSPVAVDAGHGIYDVYDLLLPMPGLYSILLAFTSDAGAKDNVVLMLCMRTKSG